MLRKLWFPIYAMLLKRNLLEGLPVLPWCKTLLWMKVMLPLPELLVLLLSLYAVAQTKASGGRTAVVKFAGCVAHPSTDPIPAAVVQNKASGGRPTVARTT